MESSVAKKDKNYLTTQEYLKKLDNEYYQKFEETEEQYWESNSRITDI